MYTSFIKKILQSELVRESLRLYGFGRDHWKMVSLSIICMAIYTILSGLQLSLVKPIIEKITKGESQSSSPNPLSNHAFDGVDKDKQDTSSASSKPGPDPVERLKTKARTSLEEISLVKKVRIIQEKATSSFTNIGIMAAILAPLIFLAFYGQEYFSNYVIWGITRDIRNRVCDHLLPQSLSFFENNKSGDLISRITNDITTTQGAINILFNHVLLQPMQFVCGMGLAFYFNWKLTLLAFIVFPLIIVPVIIFGRKVKSHAKRSLKYLGDLTDIMREMFSGIRIVKAYKMEKEESKEIHEINHRFFKKRLKTAMARAASNGMTEFIYGLGIAIIVILGGYIILTKKSTPGELGGFITAIGFMVFRSIKRLTKSYNTLQDSLAGASRVFELLDQPLTTKENEGTEELKGINEGITFDNVSFGYNGKMVVKEINLEIKKGSMIGIAGQSGAGKSTLLNLILRFYDPIRGSIRIDGQDIRRIKHESLLEHIALVSQQTFLFNRSIEENIRYGSNHSTFEEIQEVAKAANIHDFVVNLPQGYKTIVGEMGVKLSGGQKQRIAIARAFLRNSPILILDEATSSLDSRSEQLVQEALNRLAKDKTTLVVAHRLSTIKNCDKIVVIKDGMIVETGTHEELINANGEYERLYKMQTIKEAE